MELKPEPERRRSRRLTLHLPVEVLLRSPEGEQRFRATTANVSTGGACLLADLPDGALLPGLFSLLDLQLSVPPGEGHFPYPGRVHALAEVLRTEHLPSFSTERTQRHALATRFLEPLQLAF